MKKIYVFRHGETDWNKERRLQGSTDIPLNETGRHQALKLREFFRTWPVEVFLSSDLARAKETAEIAAGELDVEFVFDPRLRETNLGQAEGLTVDEVISRFGQEAWHKWHSSGSDFGNFRFPKGESKHEHLQRVFGAIEEFVHSTSFHAIGVATHGGAMRRLIHHLRPDLDSPVMVGNCSLYEISFEAERSLWTVDVTPKCVADDEA